MLNHRVTISLKFASTHLNTWVKRGTVRAKCLAQEQNTVFPPRDRTQTAQTGGEHTCNVLFAGGVIFVYLNVRNKDVVVVAH